MGMCAARFSGIQLQADALCVSFFLEEKNMVSYFKAAVLACAVAIAASGSANAAQLMLTGNVIGPAADIGKTFSLNATYTPSVTSAAVLNAVTLVVGNQTWSALLGGSNPAITIANAKSAFTIAAQFSGGSTPSSVGDIFASLSLNVNGNTVAAQQATEANINAIFDSRISALGTLTIVSSGASPFGGNVLNLEGNLSSVPEPGSLLVLGGLGLFVGRRMMVRRQNKATSVA